MPKLGVIGSLVWDVIYGRDPASPPVEEWGGIAYTLAGFDAALEPDWELVPLIKVGSDLRQEAAEYLRTLERLTPGGRCVEVTAPNNRVTLRYQSAERRCERMSGGVPGWAWQELGPMVRDLDAIYLNFISGFELELGTAHALRQAFAGPLYADLHSLFLGMPPDGLRVLRPLASPDAWFGAFDVVQLNEDEMQQLSPDPLGLAARALSAGVSLVVVTLGARGAAYVAGTGVERRPWRQHGGATPAGGGPARSARLAAPAVEALDPTGCGDVFGAVLFSRLLAGESIEGALAEATRLASRNAGYRGATGLNRYLKGESVLVSD